MNRRILKNLGYNLVLQIVTLFLPLLTIPYVSRILGAEGIGQFSFTLSITHYFILIGTLGLSIYGNRQIAYTKDDKNKMSVTFWSIFILRIITSSISLMFYFWLFYRSNNFRVIFLIQSLNIIAAMIDISWLYIGLEDFKKTVTRNLAVKLLGIVLIFMFVKSKQDLYLYIMINALMILSGNIIMWIYLPRTVNIIKIQLNEVVFHFIPSLRLFIPQVAIQVYVVLDKTMIGLLSTVNEVGYYEQSEKIVKATLSLVTALGIVMLPRMSNLFANGDKKQMDLYLNNCLIGVAYFSIPLAFGLGGISYEFVPWFLGSNFDSAKILIILLSPILFFISMSNVMGVQYLLPSNKTKEFTISVFAGAFVNLCLNLILIPKYNAIGACIGTLLAEISVMLIQFISLRKVINFIEYLKSISLFVFSSLVMLIVIRYIGGQINFSVNTTIIQIIAGVFVYFLLLTLLKEKYTKLIFKKIYILITKATFENT